MVNCSICNKDFDEKRLLIRHLKLHEKKGEINNEELNKVVKESIFEKLKCTDCEKTFSRKTYLINHQKKSCKKAKFMEFLKNSDLDFKKEVHSYLETQNLGNSGINVRDISVADSPNTTFNLNNNKFTINNLNNENTDYIESEYKELIPFLVEIKELIMSEDQHNVSEDRWNLEVNRKILSQIKIQIKGLCKTLYKLIHCNQNHPENHNIYITNLKKEIKFFIYANNMWKRTGDMKTLRGEITKIFQILLSFLEDMETEDLSIRDFRNIKQKVQSQFKNFSKGDEAFANSLAKDFFDITYLNKSILSKTYKHLNI